MFIYCLEDSYSCYLVISGSETLSRQAISDHFKFVSQKHTDLHYLHNAIPIATDLPLWKAQYEKELLKLS